VATGGCCFWETDGQCGKEPRDWCNEAEANCLGECEGKGYSPDAFGGTGYASFLASTTNNSEDAPVATNFTLRVSCGAEHVTAV